MYRILLASSLIVCLGLEAARAGVVQGERFEPSEEEVQQLIDFAAGENREGAILLSYLRMAYHDAVESPTGSSWIVFYSVAWPTGRTIDPIQFFESAQCTVEDEVLMPCQETSPMARRAGGPLFSYEGRIFDEELAQLMAVVNEFFHGEALVTKIRKESSRNAVKWRTGRHDYLIEIGPKQDAELYRFIRECESVDQCDWDVKRVGGMYDTN